MILYDFKQELPCTLTDGELLAKGDALASTLRDMELERENQVRERAAAKERMSALQKKAGELRAQIQERRELREVPCDVLVVDMDKGVVQELRRDTGEVVRERFLRDGERDQRLKGLDG